MPLIAKLLAKEAKTRHRKSATVAASSIVGKRGKSARTNRLYFGGVALIVNEATQNTCNSDMPLIYATPPPTAAAGRASA